MKQKTIQSLKNTINYLIYLNFLLLFIFIVQLQGFIAYNKDNLAFICALKFNDFVKLSQELLYLCQVNF